MLKTILPLAVGAILGAGGMWLAVDDTGPSATDRADSQTRTGPQVDRTRPRNTPSVAGRLAAYESAAAERDLAALERAIERAARSGESQSVDLEIDALLMRMAELAPARAAELAIALDLEPRFVTGAYLSWAQAEPTAALAGLAGVRDPAMRRDVALALLEEFGDGAGIERVAAALPEAERLAFTVDGLAFRAASDPRGALYDALRLGDPAFRRQALQEIASTWAAQDPISALAQADLLPADLAPVFRTTVAREWARLDGVGLLSYLETTPSPAEELVAAAAFVVSADIDRLLAVADSLPGTLAQQMKASALGALAETDPDAALARVNTMPPGPEREQAITQAGFALAMTDSDAAVQWFRGLTSLSPDTVLSTATTMMMSDPAAALELLDLIGEDGPRNGFETTLILSTMRWGGTRNPEQAARIAGRLLARNDSIGDAALDRFVSGWAERDPGAAADWALNLDQGAVRDEALRRLLVGSAEAGGPVDDNLLAGFSSDAARDEALSQLLSARTASTGRLDRGLLAGIGSEAGRRQALREAILALARKDPAAARVVLEREVGDTATRAAIERAMKSIPRLPF